jgi:zinc protease
MKTTFFAILLLVSFVSAVSAEDTSGPPRVERSSSPKPAIAEATAPIWPHDGSDLRPDSKAIFGRLDNGLRYVILPAKHAAARASLRMYVRVGSLMETEAERGIAHFLEHMAFNGSKHFPNSECVEYLQRLGMSFAADTNANTNFDRTVYQLELPRANEELTGSGLKLFRDFLDGMLLDEKQIEKERGVILSELLSRNTAAYRAASPALKFAFPDSIVSERLPIGVAKNISKFTRQQFVDFYETWYTPGRTAIVAVGDFDKDMIERLIREHFADAKARRGERADIKIGDVLPMKQPLAGLHTADDLDALSIEISTTKRAEPIHDSIARQRHELIEAMATMMLNVRLEKLTGVEKSPFKSASLGHQRLFNFAEINSLSAVCRGTNWASALTAIEQELRRALEHGFTDAEFADTKTKFIDFIKMISASAETREPSALAAEIIESLADGEVFMNPAEAMPLLERFFTDLKKEDCNAALRKTWTGATAKIWLQGNVPADEAQAEKIIAVYHASRETPVAAPEQKAKSGLAYTDFGPAGKLAAREVHQDLDLTTATFENNVRINVKRTAVEKNAIHVLVRFGNGLIDLPADKPGLNGIYISGGLEAHNLVELNQILGKKPVGIRFNVGDDAFNLHGSCTPEMLDLQFQLCAAFLTAPAFRAEARQQFLESLEGVYAERERTLEGSFAVVNDFLHGDDHRFVLPKREAMQRLTIDDLKQWLALPLREGFVEVTLVGDVDADQAIAAAAKTFGALPARAATKSIASKVAPKFPVETKAKQFAFASAEPRAAAIVCWPTFGDRDISVSRRTSALAMILNERLRVKVREELGAAYTPDVSVASSDAFADYGYLSATIKIDPARLAELSPLVVAIGNELATGSISDDEFERTMKPVLASLENRDNSYWLNALKDCQEHPENIAKALSRQKDWSSITKAELEALAKRILPAERATTIGVAPKEVK